MTTNLKIVAIALIAIVVMPLYSAAQDEGQFDPKKAVKQIKDDLESVLEDLSSLNGGEVDPKKGKEIVDQMDELLKQMKGSQDRIVDNIDQLIKNMKKNPSGSPSQKQQDQKPKQDQKPQKSQDKRDRNQKPKDGERDQPKDKKGEKPEGQSKPGDQESQKKPKQGTQKKKAPDSGVEKVPFTPDTEQWGNLPAETRQLLIEKNFRNFFPDYHKEINDYLKSLNRKR